MKDMNKNILFITCIMVLGSLLSSCGGGGSGGGSLTANVGLPLSDYVVVNLQTGSVEAYTALSDINTNDAYKTTHMVFRTIEAGSTYFGSNVADLGYQTDEVEGTGSVSKFFIGVFEVTQEQWSRISGLQPWTTIDSSALGLPAWTVIDSMSPACSLSYSGVTTGLALFNNSKGRNLGLPTDLQWELACRSGTADLFSWGNSTQTVIAGQYAVTRETTGGVSGSQRVGSNTANGNDLYDMHGNVWELTSENNLRGGSWFDNILQARSANKHSLMEDIEHNLTGVRLVYNP